jgi:two-component system response regulator PilR (NtrC family)
MSMVEKPLVLLVDDNEATCTLLAAVLQREFATEVATDGYEAIEKLKTKQYEVTLLDIRMPQLDGYGVLDWLKEHRPEALRSVIIVTAALGERELTRAREYDVYGIIPKPFDIEVLLAAVKQCTTRDEGSPLGGFLRGTMILLLADLIQKRLI